MATVRPEKMTVRPAESTVRAVAALICSRVMSLAGILGAGAQLLAEAAHGQQAVVDAQAEAEHRDDVDDGRVEVDRVGEGQQGRQRPRDRGDGPQDRHPGRHEAAEHQHHEQKADRQRHALAGAQVLLDLVGDGVDESPVRPPVAPSPPGMAASIASNSRSTSSRTPGAVLVAEVGVEGDDGEEAVGGGARP